jgi:drug/metabolite transporter (DMT)-like permease
MSRPALRAPLLLLIAAAIWGFAFVAQRAGMAHIGPFAFNGVRFLLGSLALFPLLLIRRRAAPAPGGLPWIPLLLAGAILFASASLQQIGLVQTTAGKAGFITGLYVVMVPLLGLVRGHRIGRLVWIGAIAAAGGTYLLSVTGRMTIAPGDGLVLLGAVGWAIHVHLVGWLVHRVDAIRIAVTQFAICGALSLGVGLFFEATTIDGLLAAAVPIAYAGFLSVGVAYTLQIVGQRHIDPSRAGIILSLEAVFAVLGGRLLLGEMLSGRALMGCCLMLLGMLLAQVRPRGSIAPGGSQS